MSAPPPPGSHLLVLSLDTYGDLVLRQPLLRQLLDDGQRVTLVVRPGYQDLVPFVDPRLGLFVSEVSPIGQREGHAERVQSLRQALESLAPDVVVCAPFSRTVLDEFLLRGFDGVRKVGFRGPDLPRRAVLPPLLTDEVDVAEDTPEATKNQALLAALSAAPGPPPRPHLQVGEAHHADAREALAAVGLTPGAFAVGCPAGTVTTLAKEWPAEEFASVVGHLRERHRLTVLLVGVEAEEPHLRRVAALAEARGAKAPLWIGSPGRIGTLLGLLAQSRLYVGSDSGPMHFAAALDVPVVARFGGGHWPRFLPEARRGFVATQELPCFGCGWDCWMETPACIRSVASATIERGIDQVLGGAEGRTVDRGSPLPAAEAATIQLGAAVHRELVHQRRRSGALAGIVQELEYGLASSEADRAARLEVIQEMSARLLRREAEVGELAARLAGSEADRAARLEVIHQMARQVGEQRVHIDALSRDLRHLSTVNGALRVMGGAGLRTLGLYDLAYRHRRGLNRLVAPFLPAARTQPAPAAGPPEPTAPPAVQAPLARPTLLEAFVEARSLPGDAEDLALERLHLLGASARRVLCLGGAPRALQHAFMIASGGAEVTLPGTSLHPRLAIPGLVADERDLGTWMAATGRTTLADFDALVVDASCGADERALLAGRVAPGAAVLLTGPHADDVAAEVPGLARLASVPPAWADPAPDEAYRSQKPWSAAPPLRATLPERLPSGRPWPRITVVTVSFNHAAFLEETILSVLNQDYPDLEYIVVDGGSTDGTAAILDRYRDRLAWCVSEPDRGQSHALNKGFARSTGQVLAWLNSDDRYPAGALWRAALALDAWEADVVAGGCGLTQDHGDEVLRVHHSALPVGRRVPLPLERLLDLDGSWIPGDFFYQPEVFWTRGIWERSGGRVAEELYYSMDYELWVRFAAHGARIVHVPDLLAVYRMHAAQKTSGAELPYLPELRKLAAGLKASLAGAAR